MYTKEELEKLLWWKNLKVYLPLNKRKKLMEELARKANKDQRELVEQYHKAHQEPA